MDPMVEADLIEEIVCALVDDTDSVEVKETENGTVVRFDIFVAQKDRGRVIGKAGATIAAIRWIVNGITARSGKKAVIEVVEPERQKRPGNGRKDDGRRRTKRFVPREIER